MVDNIQVLGLKDFDKFEQERIIELANIYYDKISRSLSGKLVIHAKKYNSEGRRCMYSFHASIHSPDNLIDVSEDDWELDRAVHKVLKKVDLYLNFEMYLCLLIADKY